MIRCGSPLSSASGRSTSKIRAAPRLATAHRQPTLHSEDDEDHRRAVLASLSCSTRSSASAAARRKEERPGDRDLQVGADRARSRNVREPSLCLGDHLFGSLDRQKAGDRPMKFTIARYPSSYSPASTAASMIATTSSGSGGSPSVERWVKMLMRALTSANESSTRRRPRSPSRRLDRCGCCLSISICERRARARAYCGDSGRRSRRATATVADSSASSQRPASQRDPRAQAERVRAQLRVVRCEPRLRLRPTLEHAVVARLGHVQTRQRDLDERSILVRGELQRILQAALRRRKRTSP